MATRVKILTSQNVINTSAIGSGSDVYSTNVVNTLVSDASNYIWTSGTALSAIRTKYSNVSSGILSVATGFTTSATGNYSTTEGFATKASGLRSHAEGSDTIASGDYSHAEGSANTASGLYSHVGGSTSTAGANYSFVHSNGSIINTGAAESAILGGTNNRVNTNVLRSVVVGGSSISADKNDYVFVPNLESKGAVTGTSHGTIQQSFNVPATGSQAWALSVGNAATFVLTAVTASFCQITTSLPATGVFSWLCFQGHASASKTISITQSGVTWIYQGTKSTSGGILQLGTVGIGKQVLFRLYWQSTTLCYVEQLAADDGYGLNLPSIKPGTANKLVKSTSTGLADSSITDDGTTVIVSSTTPLSIGGRATLRGYTGSDTNFAIYPGGITPSATNYALTCTNTGTYTSLNSLTSAAISISGVPKLSVTSSNIDLANQATVGQIYIGGYSTILNHTTSQQGSGSGFNADALTTNSLAALAAGESRPVHRFRSNNDNGWDFTICCYNRLGFGLDWFATLNNNASRFVVNNQNRNMLVVEDTAITADVPMSYKTIVRSTNGAWTMDNGYSKYIYVGTASATWTLPNVVSNGMEVTVVNLTGNGLYNLTVQPASGQSVFGLTNIDGATANVIHCSYQVSNTTWYCSR